MILPGQARFDMNELGLGFLLLMDLRVCLLNCVCAYVLACAQRPAKLLEQNELKIGVFN